MALGPLARASGIRLELRGRAARPWRVAHEHVSECDDGVCFKTTSRFAVLGEP